MSKENKITKVKNPLYNIKNPLYNIKNPLYNIKGLCTTRSCSYLSRIIENIRTVTTDYNRGADFYNARDAIQGIRICLKKIK